MNRINRHLEAAAALHELEERGRREYLDIGDLSAGLDVAPALENAARAVEACRSLEDVMAVVGALPAFLRRMGEEVRQDYCPA